MSAIIIRGGRPLSGSLTVQGAKNSVLPILAATLLSGEVCRIRHCPRLLSMRELLSGRWKSGVSRRTSAT